jgi:hypothetical protein
LLQKLTRSQHVPKRPFRDGRIAFTFNLAISLGFSQLLELSLQFVDSVLHVSPGVGLPLPPFAFLLQGPQVLLLIQTFHQEPLRLPQWQTLPARPLCPSLGFQALLSFVGQLFLQALAFFTQGHHKTGLLLAKMLHASLGQLDVPPRILQGESGDDEGCSTECEERADANEK